MPSTIVFTPHFPIKPSLWGNWNDFGVSYSTVLTRTTHRSFTNPSAGPSCTASGAAVVLSSRNASHFMRSEVRLDAQYALGIQVAWQVEHVLGWAGTRDGDGTSQVTGIPGPDAPAPGTSATLAIGAQAGIGVGVAAAVVAVVALGLYVWRRRRAGHQPTPEAFDKAELSGHGKEHPELMESAALQEAGGEGTGRRTEADAAHAVAELDSDWTGWEAPALLEVDMSRPGRGVMGNRERG